MSETVLAIDTSTEIASVAIVRDGQVLAENEAADAARHDHVLLPRIQSVLVEAGVTLADLSLLAVGIGPGAFGGLRVGLATIKGLALATQLPCMGVSSLHALALRSKDRAQVLTLVNAHRGELFAALYLREDQGMAVQVPPFHGTPAEVVARLRPHCSSAPGLISHDLADHWTALHAAWPELASVADATPRARDVATVALAMRGRGETARADTLLPIYIRESDAKLPAQPLRVAETKD